MFFFIGGIRPRVRPTGERRAGRCGRCGTDRLFESVRIQPCLEIFFVPLIPFGHGERAWRCAGCGTLRAAAVDQGTDPRAPERGMSESAPAPGATPTAAERPGTEPDGSDGRGAVPWSGARTPVPGGSPHRSPVGTRSGQAHRFCHHCGSPILEAPSEGRAPGFRRYACPSCGRQFEVAG